MSNSVYYIGEEKLTFRVIFDILKKGMQIQLSDQAIERIEHCRAYLNKKTESDLDPVYGINTGFGALYNKTISKADLGKLQENLVKSHACGSGDEVPQEVVKLMLLLKVQSLSYGHSGVQLITVQRLIDLFNHNLIPVVYQLGSLGASGDLAPLAHLALPLIGLGEVYYKGERQNALPVMQSLGLEPIKLQSKEGLALLNGTPVYECLRGDRLT